MKTNATLKKSSLLAALLIILIMSCNAQKPRKIEKEFKRAAKEVAKKHEWLSFDVCHQNYRNDTFNWEVKYSVIMHYDKKNPTIYVSRKDLYDSDLISEEFRITKEKFEKIMHNEHNIITYKNRHFFADAYHSFPLMGDIPVYFSRLGYYLYTTQSKIKSQFCMPATVIDADFVDVNSKSYIKYHTVDPLVTTSLEIIYNRTHTFVDAETSLIDSVYSYSTSSLRDDSSIYKNSYGEIYNNYYKIDNYSFESKQHILDSIFDLQNIRYADYAHYDEKTSPQCQTRSENKTACDELLDYPLVNLEGDTTSIREQEGWILLNFWTTGCEPCIEHLMRMAAEKDSLGYRILENEGIKILAIEHKSNNMEIIAKRASKTKSEDIMYSGKGIGTGINIPTLGYYYLVSPNKEIVYETGDLGDYSEIINKLKIES